MNPENSSRKDKFLCGCCAKPEEFNSEKVIFDYFGREFTEYEYVIENLAIRPAPKKLLDLVPVHSTNISNKTRLSQSHPSEPVQSSSTFIMSHNLTSTGEGDFRKPNVLKIRDDNDGFISFKTLDDNSQVKTGENCIPKPCSQPTDLRNTRDIAEMRKSIKSKEYRTTKQILSDLYEASEQSLNFDRRSSHDSNKPIPSEIRDTIEMLRFKNTFPEFYTRTEKKLFHTPGVYFTEVKNSEKIDQRSPIRDSLGIQHGGSSTITDRFSRNYSTHSEEIRHFAVNSIAQTEVTKGCPCPKKDKKNLKWKIIINKHSNSKS